MPNTAEERERSLCVSGTYYEFTLISHKVVLGFDNDLCNMMDETIHVHGKC